MFSFAGQKKNVEDDGSKCEIPPDETPATAAKATDQEDDEGTMVEHISSVQCLYRQDGSTRQPFAATTSKYITAVKVTNKKKIMGTYFLLLHTYINYNLLAEVFKNRIRVYAATKIDQQVFTGVISWFIIQVQS